MALGLKFVQATQRPFGATSGQQAGWSETKTESRAPGVTKYSRDRTFFSLKKRHVRASGGWTFGEGLAPKHIVAMIAQQQATNALCRRSPKPVQKPDPSDPRNRRWFISLTTVSEGEHVAISQAKCHDDASPDAGLKPIALSDAVPEVQRGTLPLQPQGDTSILSAASDGAPNGWSASCLWSTTRSKRRGDASRLNLWCPQRNAHDRRRRP